MNADFKQSLLHTGVLSAFAVAQPLYDLLARSPAFLTAHFSRPSDIVLLVIVLSVLVPLALIVIEVVARIISQQLWRPLHAFLTAILAAITILPFLLTHMSAPGTLVIGLAGLVGVAFWLMLQRFAVVRSLTSALSIAIVAFALIFLTHDSIKPFLLPEQNALSLATIEADAPVVMLVFDELPVVSLMDASGEVDRIRYPNFARLADRAWWFRDATTVSDDTISGAVPAIVTGSYPRQFPRTRESSRSLFTLLGGSYGMNVIETYTRICPTKLCPRQELFADRIKLLFADLVVVYGHIVLPQDWRTHLPSISHGWKNFHTQNLSKRQQHSRRIDKLWASRVDWFDNFTVSINKADTPQLYFLHVLLPHLPWVYLPDGSRYDLQAKGLYGVPGVTREFWSDDEWVVAQGYQRHLLQLGYVDLLLGTLLDRLESQGLFDDALLVVTADHGVSFRPGDGRRPLTQSNFPDIMRIPLFIKAPGQVEGKRSDRNVETIDILPTIAELLDIEIPWSVDGHSALGTGVPERTQRTVFEQNKKRNAAATEIPEHQLEDFNVALKKKIALFGAGGSTDSLYHFGPDSELIGRNSASAGTLASGSSATTVVAESLSISGTGPWAITGLLKSENDQEPALVLAIAVENTICAVTRSHSNSESEAAFVAFIGPHCRLQELDQLGLFEVSQIANGAQLLPIRRLN